MSDPHPSNLTLSRHLGGMLDKAENARVQHHLAACMLCRAELATLKEMNLAATQNGKPPPPSGELLNPHSAVTAPHEVGDLDAALSLEDTLRRDRGLGRPSPQPGPEVNSASGEIITGFTVGRYVVTRRLGQGAMGQVFAAYDPRLDRNVAIKLLRADLPMVENKPLRQRLEREAQALARLSHPNVVAVHDLGEHGDALFIAMDLVEGKTLTEWLKTPHPWPEVQRVFLQAAEGLAAAHRAGLVHRDFKPDNVLVGADGITRVSDFGVSRRVARDPNDDDGEDTITGAGSLIGTPMYMSPEQFDGKSADHRSDQFSFCVVLFEALSGELPFLGKSLRSLADAVRSGPPQRIPSRAALPPWLEALVLKGLATKPDGRFPSMEALIAELRGPAPKKKFPLVSVSIATAALLVASALGWREYVRRRDDPCFHIDERVATWSDEARTQMKLAVLDTGVAWAPQAVARIDSEFTRFLTQWSGDYRRACEDDAQSAGAARKACLENQYRSYEYARVLMSKPTVPLLREGLRNLPAALRSTDCGANGWYFDVPSDPARRELFTRLHSELGEVELTSRLGGAIALVPRAKALRTEATALGFPQIAAAAALLHGQLVWHELSGRDALPILEEAAVLADGSRQDAVAAEARRSVAELLVTEFEVTRARAALPAVRAAFQRLGHDPEQLSSVLDLESSVLSREGKFAESLELSKKALALLPPSEDFLHCVMLEHLGNALERAGRTDEGLARNAEALECVRTALGPDHPGYAGVLNGRAALLSRMGREAEAETLTNQSLTIYSRDPDQRPYLIALYNHGLALKRQDKLTQALPELEKAVKLAEKNHDQTNLARMLLGYAEALQDAQQLDAAEKVAARGLALTQALMGDSAQLASAQLMHGSILESLGRHLEAAAELRQALDAMEKLGGSAVKLEVTRYEYARSLWHQPETRAEAVQLVKQVRDFFAARGANFKPYTDEAEDWLRTHPPK